MLFWKLKMTLFACLDHGICFAGIFKYLINVNPLVKNIFNVLYCFIYIRLVLCYMDKIHYCLYVLQYL